MQKVSPQKTPMVVGKLLDLDCSEDFIRQLLNSVGHLCPVDELVEQVRYISRFVLCLNFFSFFLKGCVLNGAQL